MKRGWAVFGLVVGVWLLALNSGEPVFYRLAYLLTGIFLLSAFLAWYNLLGLEVTRQPSGFRAQVGKTMEERISIRNRWPLRKLWLELRDHSTLPGHSASRVVSNIGPRQSESWYTRTWCQRRGRFTLGPMTLTSSDPFGIFHVQQEFPDELSVVVYPATVDLPAFPPLVGEYPGGDAMRRRTHHVTTNVAGVREYAPGDSFNRIHWPSTARTGRLVVKEFELDPTADIWIFLDMVRGVHMSAPWKEEFYRQRYERSGPALLWERREELELPPATEEYAIVVAASLAKHYLYQGRAVGLSAYAGTREVIQADRGDRQLNKILETLAVIHPEGRVPLAQVLAGEGAALGRGVAIVTITPDPTTDWIAALRDLQRRGVRCLAVLLAADSLGVAPSHRPAASELEASGILTYVVSRGDSLKAVLLQAGPGPRPAWTSRAALAGRPTP
ncbi:MAG: DUF58 domain-containing protein [Chloroflexi bacterium]|nr:DUF58 domain-containing protein [Chloroflexota bacterium]